MLEFLLLSPLFMLVMALYDTSIQYNCLLPKYNIIFYFFTTFWHYLWCFDVVNGMFLVCLLFQKTPSKGGALCCGCLQAQRCIHYIKYIILIFIKQTASLTRRFQVRTCWYCLWFVSLPQNQSFCCELSLGTPLL